MTCEEMFPERYASVICKDETIRPTYYEGVLLWVIAYYQKYQPSGTYKLDAHKVIRGKLGMGTSITALDNMINESKLKDYFNEIEEDFKKMFQCNAKPCDKEHLSHIQYISGSITDAKSEKYPDLKYTSISMIPGNKKILKNRIPEIAGFYRTHFNHTGRIFGGEIHLLLGYNKGKPPLKTVSLLNPFQLMLMYRLSKENRTSDLAHTFSIWSPASYFAHYSDHLLFEWFLGGMIGNFTVEQLSTYHLDDTLYMLVSG